MKKIKLSSEKIFLLSMALATIVFWLLGKLSVIFYIFTLLCLLTISAYYTYKFGKKYWYLAGLKKKEKNERLYNLTIESGTTPSKNDKHRLFRDVDKKYRQQIGKELYIYLLLLFVSGLILIMILSPFLFI